MLFKLYRGFLSVGLRNKHFYLANGVQENNIFSAPHFVDNSRFKRDSEIEGSALNQLRTKYSIQKNAFCFLFCGKLQPKKRVMDLLHAFLGIRETFENSCLLIVGDGEQFDKATRFSKDHNLNVHFPGFINQTEMPKIYAISDCLVLPSDWDETWGLVVNEAMACSKPAIVSDQVGCGDDLIIEGETGYTYPCGNIDRLSDIMSQLAGDPELVKSLGKNAHNRVCSLYSLEKAVEGTLYAVKRVI